MAVELGWQELVAMLPALDAVGANEAELILGTAGNDVLDGAGGDDRIEAGAGDDELIGGAGNDTLLGGAGRDVYHFGFAAGNDTIVEADGGQNVLVFDAGVMATQLKLTLTLTHDGNDLVIEAANDASYENYCKGGAA